MGIDAEQRLALDDGRRIDTGPRLADDLEVLGILERHLLQIGRGDLCRDGGQRGIGDRAASRGVLHRTLACRQARGGNAPLLRCRRHEHGAGTGPGLARRQPVERRCHAAACKLRPILVLILVGLLDLHLAPRDVELLGDQHGQHGLDALPDLRVLREDRHRVVRRDADEHAQHRGLARAGRGGKRQLRFERERGPARKAGGEERAAGNGNGVHAAAPAMALLASAMAFWIRR